MKAVKISSEIDPLTRDTTFTFDGQQYRLRYDFQAIYDFYCAMKVNPVIEPIGTDPSRYAALLFVGLLRHQPDMTIDKVKSWFAYPPMQIALCELAYKAFEAQLPDPEPEAEVQPSDPPSA